MPRAWSTCSQRGCPTPTPPGQSRCALHERAADHDRGTAAERGYTGAGHRRFREAVLDRDPICVVCHVRVATVADHYPHSRRELLAKGLDPNDPQYGRGLCKPDHDASTAERQPGGFRITQLPARAPGVAPRRPPGP